MVRALGKIAWQFPKKFHIHLPSDPAIPLLGIYSTEMRACVHTKTCAWMLRVLSVVPPSTWKESKQINYGISIHPKTTWQGKEMNYWYTTQHEWISNLLWWVKESRPKKRKHAFCTTLSIENSIKCKLSSSDRKQIGGGVGMRVREQQQKQKEVQRGTRRFLGMMELFSL